MFSPSPHLGGKEDPEGTTPMACERMERVERVEALGSMAPCDSGL